MTASWRLSFGNRKMVSVKTAVTDLLLKQPTQAGCGVSFITAASTPVNDSETLPTGRHQPQSLISTATLCLSSSNHERRRNPHCLHVWCWQLSARLR